MPDSVRSEGRIELRPVNFAAHQVARQRWYILRDQGVLAPEDHCPPPVMQIVRCFSDKFGEYLPDASRLPGVSRLIALGVIGQSHVIGFVGRKNEVFASPVGV